LIGTSRAREDIVGLLVLILGLILFPRRPYAHHPAKLRAQLIAATGEGVYKIGYTLASFDRPRADHLGLCRLSRDGLDQRLEPADRAQAHHGGA
jgi:hypothetical protein